LQKHYKDSDNQNHSNFIMYFHANSKTGRDFSLSASWIPQLP
jgi:hypothetical protein